MTENTITPNATLQCGVMQLQDTIEACMKNHWDDFRRDSQQHFATFHKDYIAPSVLFIETEKKHADEKYKQLEVKYTSLQTKCNDLERYNALLQEKLEAVETEMKSFSQVSMIAKWEKRLHSKSQECLNIQNALDKLKANVHRLKQENTLLNTRLEKEELLKQQHCSAVTDTQVINAEPSIQYATEATTETTNKDDEPIVSNTQPDEAKEVKEPLAPPTPAIEANEADEPPNQPVEADEPPNQPVEADEPPTPAVEADEPTAEPQNTPHPPTPIPTQAETVQDTDTIDGEQSKAEGEPHDRPSTPKVEPDNTLSVANEASTPPQPVQSVEVPTDAEPSEQRSTIQEAKEDGAPDVNTLLHERQPDVTYKVKMLKRQRKDTEKTKYLFGTDKKLYEWKDGDVPGVVVGEQIEKNGKKVFKFAKLT